LPGGIRLNTVAPILVVLGLSASACLPPGVKSQDRELQPHHAVEIILAAFDNHRIVGLSDGAGHGQPDTLDFFTTLIHDPRFPRVARNIVVEFGNARYQSVMDRYVAGEPVARDELRHVWEDTTQVTGVWSLPMYERMFAEVRAVNAGRPPDRRIRVLLADPPIDWSRVSSPADEDMNDWRDAHFAHVVERDVMNRGEKALLLFGGAHLGRRVILPNSFIHLLDRRFPNQTWVVSVLDAARADPAIAARLQGWTMPAGAAVSGTWFGMLNVRQIGFTLSQGEVAEDLDAVVVLSASSPRQEDMPALESPYARELARRRALAHSTLPFRGAKIRFEENAAAFAADAGEPLQEVLRELLRDRGLRLLVKAFADSTESDPFGISSRRAGLLVDWLGKRGVGRDRLVPKGCGALRPLTFGLTAPNRAMNRRAELVRLTPTAGCEPPW
jgi:outer membrane protein OmpA-like peptidoglycan-associated protein